MDHTWWVVSMPKEFRWRNEPGGQQRWKRRWLRHLGKRCAFPTFPPLRRRRGLSLDLETGHFTCYKNRTSSRANHRNMSEYVGICWLKCFKYFGPTEKNLRMTQATKFVAIPAESLVDRCCRLERAGS